MKHHPLKSSHSGFTLVELLVAMAVASLLLGAIYTVFISVQKTSTSSEVAARAMQSLRTSIGFMESDIRMAGLRCGAIDAGIKVATATELRFTSNRSGPDAIVVTTDLIDTADLADGLQEKDLEQITYSYDAANKRLMQCLSVDDPLILCDTVAEYVENFTFEYFDATNPLVPLAFPILNFNLIRTVGVSITVEPPAGLAVPVSRTITKQIYCRNLAINADADSDSRLF